MKINWPIMRDEMINVAGVVAMAVLALMLIGVILLMTGVVK